MGTTSKTKAISAALNALKEFQYQADKNEWATCQPSLSRSGHSLLSPRRDVVRSYTGEEASRNEVASTISKEEWAVHLPIVSRSNDSLSVTRQIVDRFPTRKEALKYASDQFGSDQNGWLSIIDTVMLEDSVTYDAGSQWAESVFVVYGYSRPNKSAIPQKTIVATAFEMRVAIAIARTLYGSGADSKMLIVSKA